MPTLPAIPLPPTIRSRFVENINGLRMHVLEAGFETPGRPCVLLLHGFPELAFFAKVSLNRLVGDVRRTIKGSEVARSVGISNTLANDEANRRRNRLGMRNAT